MIYQLDVRMAATLVGNKRCALSEGSLSRSAVVVWPAVLAKVQLIGSPTQLYKSRVLLVLPWLDLWALAVQRHYRIHHGGLLGSRHLGSSLLVFPPRARV